MIISKIEISNFLSIGSEVVLDIPTDHNTTYLVKGINEDSYESNGAGKSSIFESIIYGLYGKTNRDNVKNRFTEGELSIIIHLEHNSSKYIINRTINSVSIQKDGEDVSKNLTKTSSQDFINKEFVPYEIFTKLMRISTYDVLFSSLSHSQRRDLLMNILSIDKFIDRYDQVVSNLSNRLSMINGKLLEVSSKVQGSLSYLDSSMSKLKDKINAASYDEEKGITDELRSKMKEVSDRIDDIRLKVVDSESKQSNLSNLINQNDSKLSSIRTQLHMYKESLYAAQLGYCNSCNQKLPIDDKLVNSLTGSIETLSRNEEFFTSVLNSMNTDYSNSKLLVTELRNESSKLNNEYTNLVTRLTKIESSSVKSSDLEEYDNLSSEYISNKSLSYVLEESIIESDRLKSMIQYLSRNKSLFISSLLDKMTEMLNKDLIELSAKVLDTPVRFSIDDKKVNILLGDKSVNDLSSGERRRVDLVISLGLKQYYETSYSCSTNILVLDEVLDTIDDVSEIVSKIINSTNSNLFIVSHNKAHNISYDNTMIIRKRDNISYLEVQ